ncbi:MAG: sialidase family protein [Planctomycetota bacterium]|jgi:hypothetical protein
MALSPQLEERLTRLATALVDQERARVIVPPQQASTGFWFGGGNMVEAADGTLFVTGRYRNFGDSRTGLGSGERGLELAIFESSDGGETWQKAVSFSKPELNVGDHSVLSIEGTALHCGSDGVELFVSTEKDGIGYPAGFEGFLKPGTGVWTIERLFAPTVAELKDAAIETIIECHDPRWLHIKDPFVFEQRNGDLDVLFCSHPFCWSSSNTGFVRRSAGQSSYSEPDYGFFPRGTTWDVAMTRGTAVVNVPQVGAFADLDVSLVFYDGGECLRNLDEHSTAVKRPRGYSCEEIGGAAYIQNGDLSSVERLSKHAPFFISPHGTGCSRYVDVLTTIDGRMIATWQQSQDDCSQPLVMNTLSAAEMEAVLM